MNPGQSFRDEIEFPIEVVYSLLNVCRSAGADSARARREAMRRRGFAYGSLEEIPRLSFWLRLCRQMDLVDGDPPRPTWLAPEWLGLSRQDQFRGLLDAWAGYPETAKKRILRRQILDSLTTGKEITRNMKSELGGLIQLRVIQKNGITPVGQTVLQGNELSMPVGPHQSWTIHDRLLNTPYPPNWGLLWELESYLNPISPGQYSLSKESLRLAAQTKQTPGMVEILTRGLGKSPPDWLQHEIRSLPSILLRSGVVLEFSRPEELAHLRQNPSFRRILSPLLSSHHVFLEPERAWGALRRLKRSGLLAEEDLLAYKAFLEPGELEFKKLGKTERAYLLSLLIVSGGLDLPYAPPPGLFTKLSQSLPPGMRRSAAKRADRALKSQRSEPWPKPPEEPPSTPPEDLIDFLENAIQKGETVDILYRKSDSQSAELRRLTPMLVERRGPRYYLIAYCHTRRAERTFRLDRIKKVA